MSHVICSLTQIPLRKSPDHTSEMVSQMLFGESARILQKQNNWFEVKTAFDAYQGWVECQAVKEVERHPDTKKKLIVHTPFFQIRKGAKLLYIPAGSEIPYPDPSGCFTLAGHDYSVADNSQLEKNDKNSLIQTAASFINAPYLWGGRTILGMDCSGFVQLVFKIHDIPLPRDARDQAKTGNPVSGLREAQPGDLMFFYKEKKTITHVGLYTGSGSIIHASLFVRSDAVNQKGIFNANQHEYTHKLHSIRRMK